MLIGLRRNLSKILNHLVVADGQLGGRFGGIILGRHNISECAMKISLYPKGSNAKTYKTWSRKGRCPGCKTGCGSYHRLNCKVKEYLLEQLSNIPKKYNEIRLRHGIEDDIVLSDGDMHLEDMTGNFWWLGFYKGNKRITFHITSESKISVRVEEDELKIKKVEQETL